METPGREGPGFLFLIAPGSSQLFWNPKDLSRSPKDRSTAKNCSFSTARIASIFPGGLFAAPGIFFPLKTNHWRQKTVL
jgi:hypothetical protein